MAGGGTAPTAPVLKTPPTVHPTAQVTKPVLAVAEPAAPPKMNSKHDAIKEEVVVYLTESRAGAKLLSLGRSLEQVQDKSKQITDLHTHRPDLDAELDPTGEVAKRLKTSIARS